MMSMTVATAVFPGGADNFEHHPLELTILMPCLNEAEAIEICLRKARDFLQRDAACQGERAPANERG